MTQTILAPAEAVFDAWLNPEALAHWMFDSGYKQQQVIKIDLDPFIGGAFRFALRRERKLVVYEGEFLELDRPHFLSLTWRVAGGGPETLVTVSIEERGGETFLTLIHNLGVVPDHVAEDVRRDWSSDFTSLSKLLN